MLCDESKIFNHRHGITAVLSAICLFFAAAAISAQSTDQAFPTAVTSNEISGSIRARDVGDPRDTAYFYTFNGNQGDIFVNVVTKNFNGTIDIFAGDGLRPLTKIVVYADTADSETGRVLYLRKPEKLILRIEGRTPNDDPARFAVKFAGSFVAAAPPNESDVPKLPEIRIENESGIKVNSVGTIIEVIPKPKPTPKGDVAKVDRKADEPEVVAEMPAKQDEPVPEENKPADNEKDVSKKDTDVKAAEVIITENLPPKTEIKAKPAKRPLRSSRRTAKRRAATPPKPAETENAEKVTDDAKLPDEAEAKPTPPVKKTPKPKPPDPLASISLVVLFKDGRRIEKPMNEVLRFTVDRGVLTVILKNGKINRFSILDVEKVTIENPLPQQ